MNFKKLVLVLGTAGVLVGSTLAFGETLLKATANGVGTATTLVASSSLGVTATADTVLGSSARYFMCFADSDWQGFLSVLANFGISFSDLPHVKTMTDTSDSSSWDCIDLDAFNKFGAQSSRQISQDNFAKLPVAVQAAMPATKTALSTKKTAAMTLTKSS